MLSPVATLVRRHDPDRFFTALFAPPVQRETLLTLYAFNHELARARDVASEPTLALIRLQWWREVVEGTRRRHEVATALGDALDAGAFDRADLVQMIDARETEAEPAIPTLAAWRDYVRGTAGALARAAGTLLGADEAARTRLTSLGAAYGVAGILRSIGRHAAQGRCLLPEDLLAQHELSIAAAMAAPHGPALRPVLAALRAEGLALVDEGRVKLPRAVRAAALPAILARRDLRRETGAGPRGLGDRIAVLAGWYRIAA